MKKLKLHFFLLFLSYCCAWNAHASGGTDPVGDVDHCTRYSKAAPSTPVSESNPWQFNSNSYDAVGCACTFQYSNGLLPLEQTIKTSQGPVTVSHTPNNPSDPMHKTLVTANPNVVVPYVKTGRGNGAQFCYKDPLSSGSIATLLNWVLTPATVYECKQTGNPPTAANPSGTKDCPDNIDEYNSQAFPLCDCSAFAPFCNQNQCHSCLADEDCKTGGVLPREPLSADDSYLCATPELKPSRNSCHFCKHSAGQGDHKVTLILAGFDTSRAKAASVVATILADPVMKKLYDENYFTFQYVDAPTDGWMDAWNLIKIPLSSGAMYVPNPEIVPQARTLANTVCGESDIVLVVSAHWGSSPNFGGFNSQHIEEDVILLGGVRSAVDEIRFNSGLIIHELGHSVCELSDEYQTALADYVQGINPNAINIDTDSQCSTFQNKMGVDGCHFIQGSNDYYAASVDGIMSAYSGQRKWNIPSCVGCIRQVDASTALDWCHQMFPE